MHDPNERKRHPLDQPATPPQAPPPNDDEAAPKARGGQRVVLHIASVLPTMTYAIIAINVVIFLIRALSPDIDLSLFLWGANHPPAVLGDGEWYRLFSSMFLHASIYTPSGDLALQNSLHILFNMYILFYAGAQIERLFGHTRFTLIYLLGGLTASVASTILGSQFGYSVGASGAVFAVLGAQFTYLYRHRKLLGAGGRAQMQSLLSLAVINLLFGILTSVGDGPVRVDNWAHIGGALSGLLLAWLIGPLFIVKLHPTQPNALVGEDINPLNRRYWTLSVYSIALMLVLIVARAIIII